MVFLSIHATRKSVFDKLIRLRWLSVRSAPKVASGLNVLILGANYAPEITGNAPYTSGLARGLVVRGMTVRVLTTHPHYPEWLIRPGYGSWTRTEVLDSVMVTRMRHFVPKKPDDIKRLASELSFGCRLLFAKWGSPDSIILVSPSLFSSAVAMFRIRLSRKKPVVSVWVQDLYSLGIAETGKSHGIVSQFVTWVERSTLRSASGVVVIHSRFAEYLTGKFGIAPEKIRVVRNWTHLEQVPTQDVRTVRKSFDWAPEITVVLHAGNMGLKQGLANVVNAARLADEQKASVRFVLLGDGNQRDELKKRGLGIERLQFLDSLDNAGFQGALRAADILLVNEKLGVAEMAVPSKLTSYFDAGRPVLAATASDGVTAAEIQSAQGGLIVDSEAPQALLDAALLIGQDPLRAAELGANGRRYRKDNFGEEAALDRFTLWLRDLGLLNNERDTP